MKRITNVLFLLFKLFPAMKYIDFFSSLERIAPSWWSGWVFVLLQKRNVVTPTGKECFVFFFIVLKVNSFSLRDQVIYYVYCSIKILFFQELYFLHLLVIELNWLMIIFNRAAFYWISWFFVYRKKLLHKHLCDDILIKITTLLFIWNIFLHTPMK